MVIVRCDVKVKGGLHATICRHDYILESKKSVMLAPTETDKSYMYITCKLASDEKRRVLKTTLMT